MGTKPDNLSLLCLRLIAMLDKPQVNDKFSVYAGGESHAFEVVCRVDLGQNRKCYGVIEPSTNRFIMSFSWFNPSNFLDFCTLGLKAINTQDMKDGKNAFFVNLAEEYGKTPQFRECLEKHGSKGIILTGFSMGGGTANCMAHRLCEQEGFNGEVTVIAFGSPRVGDSAFNAWFQRRLTSQSRNVIASVTTAGEVPVYDPVCTGPKTSSGFDFHPNPRIARAGRLLPLSDADRAAMEADSAEKKEVSGWSAFVNLVTTFSPFDRDYKKKWDACHSIIRYYEILSE
eukprot:GDKH01007386.1.p1 GENE.GDKH01007386.1~~GDKH01007386.1.p1  ORF type:complete len:308 (+),score=43.81 GDKH01007386.1:72-926(+)